MINPVSKYTECIVVKSTIYLLNKLCKEEKPNMRRTTTCILILLMLVILPGCMHQQSVTQPYPRWGEEIHVNQINNTNSLILRVLLPPEPNDAPACVLLVHGMNEYIGRYSEIAHYFARRFIVAGFDLYAHGLSNPILKAADQALITGATRQEVSDAYLTQTPLYDLEPMRQDMDRALRRFITLCNEQGQPEKPVFIISHSLGSLVAASYLHAMGSKYDPATQIQGIILLAPAFSVTEVPGWRGWLANPIIKLSFHAKEHFLNPQDEPLPLLIMNQIVSLITVPLFDGLFEFFSWPGLRQLFTPISPDWIVDYLTDSEEEKIRIRMDGWIIHRNLLRYVKGIEAEIVRFRRYMSGFTTPYYLIYSGHDPITPSWGSQDFARATLHTHPDNTLLSLPELNHHQHLFSSESLRHMLLGKIDQWLDQRLSTLQHQKTTNSSGTKP